MHHFESESLVSFQMLMLKIEKKNKQKLLVLMHVLNKNNGVKFLFSLSEKCFYSSLLAPW